MAVGRKLVEQIDALTRSDFRASVNATRRATLAIGALVLHWGQFDSDMGSMIQWLRERHKMLGFDGFPDAHPSDQAGQLNLLRKLIKACSADAGHLSEFDRIRQVVVRTTSIRNDLVHGAMGLGNNTGAAEGLYVFCAPHRKARRSDSGILPSCLEFRSHLVRAIFEAADDLWSSRESLERLVRVVLDN